MTSWIILIVAGFLEVGWAVGLKYTEGFTRLWPSVGTAAALVLSIVLLGISLKTLPMGTAYAVWVGIGIVGTAVTGTFLGEPVGAGKIAGLLLIITGIVTLKVNSQT